MVQDASYAAPANPVTSTGAEDGAALRDTTKVPASATKAHDVDAG